MGGGTRAAARKNLTWGWMERPVKRHAGLGGDGSGSGRRAEASGVKTGRRVDTWRGAESRRRGFREEGGETLEGDWEERGRRRGGDGKGEKEMGRGQSSGTGGTGGRWGAVRRDVQGPQTWACPARGAERGRQAGWAGGGSFLGSWRFQYAGRCFASPIGSRGLDLPLLERKQRSLAKHHKVTSWPKVASTSLRPRRSCPARCRERHCGPP